MTTSLSANCEDRARVVNQDVGVEDEVFHCLRGPWDGRANPAISVGHLLRLRLAARDGDLLHDDVLTGLSRGPRSTPVILRDQRQRLAQAEDGVAAVEVLGRPLGDEELRAVRVAGPALAMASSAGLVELQVGRELVLELVARVAGARRPAGRRPGS